VGFHNPKQFTPIHVTGFPEHDAERRRPDFSPTASQD
jgi:hypothetical protein